MDGAKVYNYVSEYLDERIFVFPIYGWGWTINKYERVAQTLGEVDVPMPFWVNISYYYIHNNIVRGAFGKIDQPSHIYNQEYFVFFSNTNTKWNLRDKLSNCNLLISKHCPEQIDSKIYPGDDWPVWIVQSSPFITGYATIGSSDDVVAHYYAEAGLTPPI